jgi:acyl-CoA hydrolase
VNRVSVINRNPKVTAINSAVEIDLTGQVCADSIGHRIISGVGGQMDFMRGAMTSEGGKPIIALTSRTAKGVPRIVPTLRRGAGVVTTRAHVQYIVTENGAVDLYGKTLSERAQLLITIAHPDDQEDLERAWFEMHA